MAQGTTPPPPGHIYKMELGESMEFSPYFVTRVPNGWMFARNQSSSVFVPESIGAVIQYAPIKYDPMNGGTGGGNTGSTSNN